MTRRRHKYIFWGVIAACLLFGLGRYLLTPAIQVFSGDVVINERVDRFHIGDGWLELPVAGFWEVRDGLITLWRDCFDMSAYTSQLDALVGDG